MAVFFFTYFDGLGYGGRSSDRFNAEKFLDRGQLQAVYYFGDHTLGDAQYKNTMGLNLIYCFSHLCCVFRIQEDSSFCGGHPGYFPFGGATGHDPVAADKKAVINNIVNSFLISQQSRIVTFPCPARSSQRVYFHRIPSSFIPNIS